MKHCKFLYLGSLKFMVSFCAITSLGGDVALFSRLAKAKELLLDFSPSLPFSLSVPPFENRNSLHVIDEVCYVLGKKNRKISVV